MNALLFCLLLIVSTLSFTRPMTAQSPTDTHDPKDLTNLVCNPYRIHYEQAIASGIIQRPSLVQSRGEALERFRQALRAENRIEAAARAAQYLVIVSEGDGIQQTTRARRQIESEIATYYLQPVDVGLPLFVVILPDEIPCPAY